MAEIDPLLEDVLRRGGREKSWLQEETRKQFRRKADVERFLAGTDAERRAKLSETLGINDLLTFLPASAAAKSAIAGNKLGAVVNALAFTSQFDDSNVGRTVGDLTAAFPVFGVGSTGRLRNVAKAAAEKGRDLPVFHEAGKISPARQRELYARMEKWIPLTSTKDPEKRLAEFSDWMAATKGAGTRPVDKHVILDRMPASLRQPFYQSLKEMGYGGVRIGERSKAPMDKFGTRVTKAENLAELEAAGKYTSGGRMNPTQVAPAEARKFEDILQFEQSGGKPAGWAAANPGREPLWVARPGETLAPGQRNFLGDKAMGAGAGGSARDIDPKAKAFLEQMAIGSGIGAAANLANDGNPLPGGDNRAGLVLTPRNMERLVRDQQAYAKFLNEFRSPGLEKFNAIEAAYAAKYPKLYARALNGTGPMTRIPVDDSVPRPAGSFAAWNGRINLEVPKNTNKNFTEYGAHEGAAKVLAHEFQHAADFSRIPSGLKAPGVEYPGDPVKIINFGDFVTPGGGIDPQNLLERFAKLPSTRPSALELAKKRGPGEPSYINSQKDWVGYRYQPVEKRAHQAEKTASKAIDYLLWESEMRKKNNLAGGPGSLLGLGTAGLGAVALTTLAAGSAQNDDQNRAGLVVNKRNIGRLRDLQAAAAERLDKIRPAFPELNYLESVFAAKYPKIYEKSVGASPKKAFNVLLTEGTDGSFSPYSGRTTVGIPSSATGWEKPSTIPEIFNTMGHESLHGLDFQRLGKVNHPWTGRKLDVGDFVTPAAAKKSYNRKDLRDNLSRFYADADKMVKNLKPKYTLPSDGDENFLTRFVKDAKYLVNPIELRARKAGKTSSKTLSDLMDKITSDY